MCSQNTVLPGTLVPIILYISAWSHYWAGVGTIKSLRTADSWVHHLWQTAWVRVMLFFLTPDWTWWYFSFGYRMKFSTTCCTAALKRLLKLPSFAGYSTRQQSPYTHPTSRKHDSKISSAVAHVWSYNDFQSRIHRLEDRNHAIKQSNRRPDSYRIREKESEFKGAELEIRGKILRR